MSLRKSQSYSYINFMGLFMFFLSYNSDIEKIIFSVIGFVFHLKCHSIHVQVSVDSRSFIGSVDVPEVEASQCKRLEYSNYKEKSPTIVKSKMPNQFLSSIFHYIHHRQSYF